MKDSIKRKAKKKIKEILKKLKDKPEYNPPKGRFDEVYIKGLKALECDHIDYTSDIPIYAIHPTTGICDFCKQKIR